MNKELEMTPNVLVEFLQKPASEFTKEDIIRYIYEKDIQMVNFYVSCRRRTFWKH